MRLILVDRGKEFCDALRWQFRSHPEVQVGIVADLKICRRLIASSPLEIRLG